MIIVSMGAGLGNQMFEYAFFYKIKKIYKKQIVKADVQYAFPLAHNGIEIFDIFGIQEPTSDVNEVKRLATTSYLNGQGFSKKSILDKVIRRMGIKKTSMIIQNDFSEFDHGFFELDENKSYYLYGVYANYKYFSDISKEIREIYAFPDFSDNMNISYMEQIKNGNSVSIHIRRGDYIDGGIELTSKKFYEKAVDIIDKKIVDAKYFVFTDDKKYARELFPDNTRFVLVEGNEGKSSFRDMQLMSLCKHNIVANSTFSFWGAFLNRYENKIVIAPNLPFTGLKCPFVCDEWLLI